MGDLIGISAPAQHVVEPVACRLRQNPAERRVDGEISIIVAPAHGDMSEIRSVLVRARGMHGPGNVALSRRRDRRGLDFQRSSVLQRSSVFGAFAELALGRVGERRADCHRQLRRGPIPLCRTRVLEAVQRRDELIDPGVFDLSPLDRQVVRAAQTRRRLGLAFRDAH